MTAGVLTELRREARTGLEEADRVVARIVVARADANGDDEHDPEGATVGFERAQADAMRTAATHRLVEVDAALHRLAAGTYGLCEVCGEAIPAGRLEARPVTTRCLRHAQAGGGAGWSA